jgi:RimJ/RimL family protein N-acetyltransferase
MTVRADVCLRLADEDDLALINALTTDPELTGEFGYFGWFDPRKWHRMWEQNGLVGDDLVALIVVCDDQPQGFVVYRRKQTTPSAFHWEIGIALHPRARGNGYGAEAQRQLADYLFRHTTAHRVEAHTEIGNLAEQRALEKAGFVREGVTRGAAWRDGAWRDGVTYSLLRTDPLPSPGDR